MIRLTLLWLVIACLCAYSFRDWFKVACSLLVLMPLYGHPDMPSGMLGIQGLNPWNLVLACVTLSFFASKTREGLRWDLDGRATLLLIAYSLIIMISFWRLYADGSVRQYLSGGEIVSEYLINAFKRLAPAFFVFMGARTEDRRRWVLWALFAAHLYVTLMVFRRVPLSTVTNGFDLTQRALKVLEEVFSWSRVNVAMLLAGASWATLFSLGYLLRDRFRWLPLMMFGLMTIALALTGGRTGWGVWAVLALLFSLTRWRKGLLLIPVVVAVVLTLLPSVTDRLLQGTATQGGSIVVEDMNEVTSGRTEAWSVAWEKIRQSPLIGYGREAMFRSGAMEEVSILLSIPEGERGFSHPHNAYLLMLMDSGWLGAIPVFLLWALIVVRAIRVTKLRLGEPQSPTQPRSKLAPSPTLKSKLAPSPTVKSKLAPRRSRLAPGRRKRDDELNTRPKDREAETIGMVTLSMVLGMLIAGVGSQDLFPEESTVLIWAAIGLMLRLHVERFPARRRLPARARPRLAADPLAPMAYRSSHAGQRMGP